MLCGRLNLCRNAARLEFERCVATVCRPIPQCIPFSLSLSRHPIAPMNVIIEKCIDKKNSTILCDYYAVNEREREYENKRGENNYIFANSPTATSGTSLRDRSDKSLGCCRTKSSGCCCPTRRTHLRRSTEVRHYLEKSGRGGPRRGSLSKVWGTQCLEPHTKGIGRTSINKAKIGARARAHLILGG